MEKGKGMSEGREEGGEELRPEKKCRRLFCILLTMTRDTWKLRNSVYSRHNIKWVFKHCIAVFVTPISSLFLTGKYSLSQFEHVACISLCDFCFSTDQIL